MPIIDTNTFLELADRMSANYEILLNWESSVNAAATNASVTIDPFGGDNALVFTAQKAGADGNQINIEYIDPGAALSALAITVENTYDIKVSLETDAGSAIISTADDVLAAIEESNEADLLVSVANSGLGTGEVAAFPTTFLTGGLHGFTNPIVLCTKDQDVVAPLNEAAFDFDTFMTAAQVVQNSVLWDNLIISLRNHLTAEGQANLIDGYLTDNDIRVHENFNILHESAVGSFLSGPNVFRKDVIEVAVIDLVDGAGASVTINPIGAAAILRIDPTGFALDNAVDYEAVTPGVGGNAINIEYRDPALPSEPLHIDVQGKDIVVFLATDGASLITTIASDIDTAITAHTLASALVTTSLPGTGADLVTAIAQTYLTNRNTSITYTAINGGSDGNEISVEYIDPLAALSALSTTVVDNRIIISLETDAGSAIISTADDVKTDVDGTPAAAALVTTTANDDNLGIVSPVSRTFLTGGVDAVISESTPLGVGTGDATDDNFAAQWLEVCPNPASKQASLEVYPDTATAFLIAGMAIPELRLDAVTPGTGGNLITFEVVYDQSPSVAESVAVVGTAITVTLATDAASVITSTIASIVATIAGSGAASALVTGSVETAGTVTCAFPITALDNTRTRVLYTAVDPGEAGNTITIEYIDPAAPSIAESVAVIGGTAIEVTLETDIASDIISTPATIIATVNGFPAAAALVTAAPVAETDGFVDAFGPENLTGGAGPSLRRETTLELTLLKSDLTSVVREVTVFPAGFNLRLTDPALGAGTGKKVAVSPDGRNVAVAITASPFVQVIPFASAGGIFGTPVADPGTLPAGAGEGVAWSPDGNFIAVAHATSPFVSVYEWTGDAFGAKIADPATLPTGDGFDVKWNPLGSYIAVAHDVSPFVSVYPWTGVFGAKVADPVTLPAGIGNAVDWAPDDSFIAVGHDVSPFVTVYPWVGSFGLKIADPATLPASDVKDVVFHPDGGSIATAHTTTPFVSVYDFAGTFGIKFSDPTTLPAGDGLSVGFTPLGTYIAVGFTGADYLHIYPWNDRFGDVIVTTDVPGDTGGVDFHPNGQFLFAGVVNGAGSPLIGYEFNSTDCQPVDAVAATLLLVAFGDDNDVLYTAVEPGADGNNITVTYADPGIPCSALAVGVVDQAITVTLETDFNGRIVSTADEIIAAVNAFPAAAALVIAENSGLGHQYVSLVSGTLAGGFDRERFFSVTAVGVTEGGEAEDQFIVQQVVERQITL